jgi:hypothetical protein
VLWGPAKCGKSFWAMSTALHVALNWEYRGRKVNGGPVVYCAFEGAEGYGKRAEAFRRRYLQDHQAPVPFFLIAARADLIADHHMLITSIRTCLQDRAPVAVYLDTLNRSLNGSESSDQDMNAYLRAADAVREAFGCLVIIVHHCGIDPSRPRGHTSLTGAVDAQLACRRDAADNIIVTVEWMKDGPEGDTDVSRLEPVEVGSEEGGGPITSCVVVPAVDATPAVAGRAERMPRGAARALRALREALQEGDPHTIEGRAVLAIEVWRSWAYRQGISLSNQPRAQQAAFQRAVAHLVAAGLVVVDGDYAWPADNGSGEHANKANTL